MINLFITHSVYFLSLTYISLNICKPRIKKEKLLYFISILFALLLTVLTHSVIVSTGKTTLMNILFLIYIISFYKCSTIRTVFIIFLIMILACGAEITANFILSFFSNLEYLNNANSLGYTIVSALSNLLTCLFSYMIVKIITGLDWTNFPKYIYLIFILPIATLLLFFNLNNYTLIIKSDIALVLCLILLVASNFITVFVFVNIINTTKQINEINAKKEFYNLRYKYIAELYNSNFRFMHGIIRKLMKIQNSFDDNDIGTIKLEIYKLNHSILKNFNLINTSSNVIGPILNSYSNSILSNNIEFVNVLEHDDFSFLEIGDQRDLFNNLLDIGVFCCKSCNSSEKLMILKSIKMERDILIQLLFSRADVYNSNEFIEKYNVLNKIVRKNFGTLTLEEKYDENISSLLIILES
ncbi:hypothetical protein WKT02_12215 [Erysipelotrichaceae bacterium HCN-30851]